MERSMIINLENNLNKNVCIKGWAHRIRKLKKIAFIILRDRTGLVQCVVDPEKFDITGIRSESVISVEGIVNKSTNSIGNVEIQVSALEILSPVNYELPIEINVPEMEVNLDTILNNRVLSLRHPKINATFKIQALLAQGFGEYLCSNGFTQVFSPKLVKEGAEGGTAMFEVKYFENKAYLAQSPQTYKQMLVASGFERVFEIGHVYRAEEHNTNRHLNEYVSLDLEMGFIEDEKDIMNLETCLLKYMFKKLEDEGKNFISLLEIDMPSIGETIPSMRLSDAIAILKSKYCKQELEEDLDPEGEILIGKYAKEELNSDFIFLTHYPRKKRPMYTMPYDEKYTKSFDLLFRGLEITTGGQRIHSFDMLKENMIYKGLNPDNFTEYLEAFKYGMPPHGGLAIGLERLTAQLIRLKNVREASLFPRDRTRLIP